MYSKMEAVLIGARQLTPAVDLQITCGRKGATGAPVDKDRYFFMRHRPDRQVRTGGKMTEARSQFPGLDALQGSSTFSGHLVHDDFGMAAQGSGFIAYRPPGQPVAPNARPWCSSSDGETATRWMGSEWKEIACPNRLCPHLMEGCKIKTSLVFALAEPGFPALLSRWSTQSIHTFSAVAAFRRTVAGLMESMGLPVSFLGVPIRVAVREKTTTKGRFPVQDVTLGGDLGAALAAKHRLISGLAGLMARVPLALAEGDAYPEADDHDLSGPPVRVLSAPATLPRKCPECGAPMEPKQGRSGLGWSCTGCPTMVGPDGTVHHVGGPS